MAEGGWAPAPTTQSVGGRNQLASLANAALHHNTEPEIQGLRREQVCVRLDFQAARLMRGDMLNAQKGSIDVE
jgi:hypothetical protein